jgi:uncharacterized protein
MQAQTASSALVFMAKWPEAGAAKTRLSPPLTLSEAAELAQCFLLDTLAQASTIEADRFIAFSPLSACEKFRKLVGPDVGLIAAQGTDLGDALYQAQSAALALGYSQVALVGSDLPHLPRSRYQEALAGLSDADVVIGPCPDGGYYLLATKSETPALFEHVTWSSPAVYQQTLAQASKAGLRVTAIASCEDIDTAADLPPLLETLRGRPGAGHTLALLEPLSESLLPAITSAAEPTL